VPVPIELSEHGRSSRRTPLESRRLGAVWSGMERERSLGRSRSRRSGKKNPRREAGGGGREKGWVRRRTTGSADHLRPRRCSRSGNFSVDRRIVAPESRSPSTFSRASRESSGFTHKPRGLREVARVGRPGRNLVARAWRSRAEFEAEASPNCLSRQELKAGWNWVWGITRPATAAELGLAGRSAAATRSPRRLRWKQGCVEEGSKELRQRGRRRWWARRWAPP
jgi:hypothetical protein